jgi:putative transposase
LSQQVGSSTACESLGVSRATLYRRRKPVEQRPQPAPRPCSARALSAEERGHVLAVLRSEEFVDLAPPQVYAILLEQGKYLCSVSTMYRILAAAGESRERRSQLRHPNYSKPVLRAKGPNEVWSWDITKLLGPAKWTYYYLYVVLDIYSRYVVGWLLAGEENARLAKQLIETCFRREGVEPGGLSLHSDRGSPMTSKTLALKLADLGVTKSLSRPRVSNDNPYSESQFKTLKYRPEYPGRFGSIADAREYCRGFFPWYNHEHRHSSLGYLTPGVVHSGLAEEQRQAAAAVLAQAFERTPERFVNRPPMPLAVPAEAWINAPTKVVELAPTEPDSSEVIAAVHSVDSKPSLAAHRAVNGPQDERSELAVDSSRTDETIAATTG